jgi:hypothetical protein
MGGKRLAISDYVGKQYGYLRVCAEAPFGPKSKQFRVRADCINRTASTNCKGFWVGELSQLKRGTVTSCGCRLKDYVGRPKSGRSDRDQVLFTCVSNMKSQARRAGHEWQLSDELAIELITSKCIFWSDADPCPAPRKSTSSRSRNGLGVVRGGIDRLDSLKEYTPDNCVPCCYYHNRLKNNVTPKQMRFMADVIDRVEPLLREQRKSEYLVPDPSLGSVH